MEELQDSSRAEPGLTALSLIAREAEGGLGEDEIRGLLSSLALPGRTASNIPVAQLSGGQLVRIPCRHYSIVRKPTTNILRIILGPSCPSGDPLEDAPSVGHGRNHDSSRFPCCHCAGLCPFLL